MTNAKSKPQTDVPKRTEDVHSKSSPADDTKVDPEPALQGEGNISAGRRYNQATRDFVASGKVTHQARQAAPKTAQEAEALQRAEAEGKRHAKR